MEYRLIVLLLRVLLGSVVALVAAVTLFIVGAVTVVPLMPYSITVVTANLVIGAGLGAGVAGWYFGLRIGSSHASAWYELPVTIALGLACSWLGQLFLDDLLYANVHAVRVETISEIFGALTGAVAGAMLLPLCLGVWRAAYRQEP